MEPRAGWIIKSSQRSACPVCRTNTSYKTTQKTPAANHPQSDRDTESDSNSETDRDTGTDRNNRAC